MLLRMRDLLGCLFCIVGGSVIVASTPAHPVDPDIDVFLQNVQARQRSVPPRALWRRVAHHTAAGSGRPLLSRTLQGLRQLGSAARRSRSSSPTSSG